MNSKKISKKLLIGKIFFAFTLMLCIGCAASKQGPIVSSDQVKHHSEVVVKHLPEGINSKDDDFALMIGSQQIYAYLTSDRSGGQGRQDVYRTSKPFTTIEEAAKNNDVLPVTELNTDENEGAATFTPDGHTMIFAAAGRSDGLGSSDLYQADLVGGKWTNIRNLTALNTSSWESQPTISSDGRTLYFVSDRDGGFGGQDLYVSSRVGDNWTAPQNLGSTINTDAHEASPFIAADGKTLYFSSKGHAGLGGFDVYVTKNVGGVWSNPENAGTPINSIDDDLFYSAELGTQHAFLSSNRDSSIGALDIFSVEPNPFASGGVTVVHGFVRDAQTKKPLAASVEITNLRTNETVARFRSSDSTGEYLVVLQPGETYSITADAEAYLFYSDRYDVTKTTDTQVEHDIYLSPTLSGRTRLLVFFDFNSATLKSESFPDLNRAVTILKNNPQMKITVAGYTDSVGSAEYNKTLSDSRAKSVKLYLSEHGIQASRIDAIGYGEENPIAPNTTEEGRALNRRVEFQVRQ